MALGLKIRLFSEVTCYRVSKNKSEESRYLKRYSSSLDARPRPHEVPTMTAYLFRHRLEQRSSPLASFDITYRQENPSRRDHACPRRARFPASHAPTVGVSASQRHSSAIVAEIALVREAAATSCEHAVKIQWCMHARSAVRRSTIDDAISPTRMSAHS